MQANYLNSIQKQFEYYKILGDKTFAQLSEAECLWKHESDNNSIAIIVNHMWGNMLSRWTDFLTTDGEKEWRNRDQEFQNVIHNKAELIEKWEAGWDCLFTALKTLTPENLETKIFIRNQSHSIVEAVNRQMMHYAYHVGQIVYIGRMIKGNEWTSLSIAKGASKAFNTGKFSKGKHDGHFTDDIK